MNFVTMAWLSPKCWIFTIVIAFDEMMTVKTILCGIKSNLFYLFCTEYMQNHEKCHYLEENLPLQLISKHKTKAK